MNEYKLLDVEAFVPFWIGSSRGRSLSAGEKSKETEKRKVARVFFTVFIQQRERDVYGLRLELPFGPNGLIFLNKLL